MFITVYRGLQNRHLGLPCLLCVIGLTFSLHLVRSLCVWNRLSQSCLSTCFFWGYLQKRPDPNTYAYISQHPSPCILPSVPPSLGNIKGAIEKYTEAIAKIPGKAKQGALLYGNRSACYLQSVWP